MKMWEWLQVLTALGLAVAAAIVSCGPLVQQSISTHIAQSFSPQMTDLGPYMADDLQVAEQSRVVHGRVNLFQDGRDYR